MNVSSLFWMLSMLLLPGIKWVLVEFKINVSFKHVTFMHVCRQCVSMSPLGLWCLSGAQKPWYNQFHLGFLFWFCDDIIYLLETLSLKRPSIPLDYFISYITQIMVQSNFSNYNMFCLIIKSSALLTISRKCYRN